MLTVIERVPINAEATKHRWLCSCACGREVKVATEALRAGQRKSCGCLRSTGYLVGNKYGKLTVESYEGRDATGRIMVKCGCECGGKKVTAARNLSREFGLHCGCMKIVLPTLRKEERPMLVRQIMASYKSNAQRKGRDFLLSLVDFETLILSDCYYCGSRPTNRKELRGVELFWTGIDRKENSKGYVLGNVVPCCTECNYMKCERDHDEFLERVRSVYKNRLTEGS